MNKVSKKEKSILIVEKDIGAMVSPLRHMMKEFGHYDPRSSWHAALIENGDGKLRRGWVRSE